MTGHRLPNAKRISGRALNLQVMDCLRDGMDARSAVVEVLSADPHADAGIIAIDSSGAVFAGNSERVTRRPDLGGARREDPASGAVIEVLHNAVYPTGSIASLAADIGLAVMAPDPPPDGEIVVRAGVPVARGKENSISVDAHGEARRVETTDERILDGRHNCAAIYLDTAVVRDGTILGTTTFEPNVVVQDGQIVTLNGRTEMRIPYRAADS